MRGLHQTLMNSDFTENVIKMILKRTPILQTEKIVGLVLIGLASASAAVGAEKSLDFWDEAPRLFTVANEKQSLYHDIDRRKRPNYKSGNFKADHVDKKMGDLSVVYDAGKAGSAKTFGFVSSLWGGVWELDNQFSLNLYVNVTGSAPAGACTIALVDQAGKKAVKTIAAFGQDDWQALQLPLAAFKAEVGFDFSKVAACRLKAELPKDALVWLDGIQFIKGETVIGVTDKPISQRMAEAEANREVRVMEGFRLGSPHGSRKSLAAFRLLYLNQDLEKANELLLEHIEDQRKAKDLWSLTTTQSYCRLYYMFSNRVGKFPGRMTPEVEKQLLEAIWERTQHKNDIHWARQSTWWMDGSHNHDLNAKVCNLLSSRIFMNEPDYKDRIYPDYGFGGAYHYGPAGYVEDLPDWELRAEAGAGRASLKDGKEYNAEDHYEAWVAFFKEYFRERARRGFFLEANAGYMTYTMCFVDSVYQLSGDEELHQVMDDFLTLFWAEWAQRQISGVQGGTKVRLKGLNGYNRMALMGAWLLGGAGTGDANGYWNMTSDFRLPKVVWQMALDREGMGEYAFISRGVGEEENLHPRPAGTERTLLCDTDSRFVKYCYMTPDYTLGLQMEHPDVVHSHLSITDRWQGMTFAQSPDSKIVFRMYPESERELPDNKKHSIGGGKGMKNLQHKNVQIIQVARNFHVISPDWFPGKAPLSDAQQIVAFYVGSDWDEKVEKDGWIFLRKADAYAALRPAIWDKEAEKKRREEVGEKIQHGFNNAETAKMVAIHEKAYTWSTDSKYIELVDPYSPVILQAGRKANDGSFYDFMGQISSNPIALYQTVVPGYNTLVYQPFGAEGESLVFNGANNEIPRIDGTNLDYEHSMTFDSPYLKSEYKSGKVKIQYGGEALDLDFSDKPWWRIW